MGSPVSNGVTCRAPSSTASQSRGGAKIAANFSVLPYGERSTLLSYECRTLTTDPESRRRFLRDWWVIRPFVGHIVRATAITIKADAEAAARPMRRRCEFWSYSAPSASEPPGWPA
jgi:hypothetical protein